ncbi:uncharacterized protein LOC125940285 [Dermacentor silvarum]|uniref:uncharacterized protein LOC125940285 n=1 Tax=Dermacentor silvarum TaxID=543639 RepID=UPI0021016F95|nr:uncharacterized protein LOC125940285 [Dermacentor silvarum]
MGLTAHWKPSQAGLLVSTTVVLRLSHELLNKLNYKYLLTGRLSQDCLENIFSVLRLRKPVPSAYDVKCALKLICVGQFVNTPTSSSYGVDDSTHLADLLEPSFKQDQVEGQEPEELENLFVYALTTEECDILAYLGGFLLKSVIGFLGECKDCERALVGDATGQYNALIQLKEYVKNSGKLIQPSQTVMQVLIECEENFKTFANMNEILTLKAPFTGILSALRKSVAMRLGCCDAHESRACKMLLEKYVRTRLKIHLRQQHAQRATLVRDVTTLKRAAYVGSLGGRSQSRGRSKSKARIPGGSTWADKVKQTKPTGQTKHADAQANERAHDPRIAQLMNENASLKEEIQRMKADFEAFRNASAVQAAAARQPSAEEGATARAAKRRATSSQGTVEDVSTAEAAMQRSLDRMHKSFTELVQSNQTLLFRVQLLENELAKRCDVHYGDAARPEAMSSEMLENNQQLRADEQDGMPAHLRSNKPNHGETGQ